MMQMSKLIFDQMVSLVIGDVTKLADPTFTARMYTSNNFTPRPNMVIGDLTAVPLGLATNFEVASAIPTFGFKADDPFTWEIAITKAAPGFHFYASGTLLPVTVTGSALCGSAGSPLYAVERYDPPVVLSQTNCGNFLGNVFFSVPPSVIVTE